MDKLVVGIAGLGLIGGSFAMEMQAHGYAVLGYDINKQTCATAMDLGFTHHCDINIGALEDSTAIFIAVPVGSTREVLAQIATLETPNLKAIFDSGSTKASILTWAHETLGAKANLFVACHPIAGTEHSGIRAATAGLFRDRRVIMCDPPANNDAVTIVTKLWEDCQAKIDTMTASEHDRLFAAVSHLPHLLAYTLVGDLGNKPERDLLLRHAASGFADFTRIASSDPDMWRDVCLANKDNIIREMELYLAALSNLRNIVAEGDGEALRDYFQIARDLRDNWIANRTNL